MGEEKFDDICANITACLTSSKRKVSISELNKDYHCILGEYIPYRKCGFKTLEDLVRSLPNVRLSVVGSEIFIDAKPDEKTAHIVDLVRNQKPAKKKSKGNKYGMYNKKSNQWKQPDNRNSSNCSNSYSSDTYNKSSSGRYDKKSHKNSYKTSKNDGVSNHVNGSYNNRKYIDWDQPEDESYLLRKYKSSRPSDLDFSEGEHDDFVDYDDFLDDLSPTGNDEQSALDNFTNLHVTLDKGRKVSDKKDNVLTYRTSKSNWQDDDVGYSSMNSINDVKDISRKFSPNFLCVPGRDQYNNNQHNIFAYVDRTPSFEEKYVSFQPTLRSNHTDEDNHLTDCESSAKNEHKLARADFIENWGTHQKYFSLKRDLEKFGNSCNSQLNNEVRVDYKNRLSRTNETFSSEGGNNFKEKLSELQITVENKPNSTGYRKVEQKPKIIRLSEIITKGDSENIKVTLNWL